MSNKVILNLVDYYNFLAQEKNITISKEILEEIAKKLTELTRKTEEKIELYVRSIGLVFVLGANPKDDDIIHLEKGKKVAYIL